jgi:hypothetical protein
MSNTRKNNFIEKKSKKSKKRIRKKKNGEKVGLAICHSIGNMLGVPDDEMLAYYTDEDLEEEKKDSYNNNEFFFKTLKLSYVITNDIYNSDLPVNLYSADCDWEDVEKRIGIIRGGERKVDVIMFMYCPLSLYLTNPEEFDRDYNVRGELSDKDVKKIQIILKNIVLLLKPKGKLFNANTAPTLTLDELMEVKKNKVYIKKEMNNYGERICHCIEWNLTKLLGEPKYISSKNVGGYMWYS